jgi:hypothetical protein
VNGTRKVRSTAISGSSARMRVEVSSASSTLTDPLGTRPLAGTR